MIFLCAVDQHCGRPGDLILSQQILMEITINGLDEKWKSVFKDASGDFTSPSVTLTATSRFLPFALQVSRE